MGNQKLAGPMSRASRANHRAIARRALVARLTGDTSSSGIGAIAYAQALGERKANSAKPAPGTPERAKYAAQHGEAPTHIATFADTANGTVSVPIHGATSDDHAHRIAQEMAAVNRTVVQDVRPYRMPKPPKGFNPYALAFGHYFDATAGINQGANSPEAS